MVEKMRIGIALQVGWPICSLAVACGWGMRRTWCRSMRLHHAAGGGSACQAGAAGVGEERGMVLLEAAGGLLAKREQPGWGGWGGKVVGGYWRPGLPPSARPRPFPPPPYPAARGHCPVCQLSFQGGQAHWLPQLAQPRVD